MPKRKTAAEILVELGVNLAGAEANPSIPVSCKHCGMAHDPKRSIAHYRSIFCSKICEGEFIRAALRSLTLDDCIRLQAKLEELLQFVQEPLPFERKQP